MNQPRVPAGFPNGGQWTSPTSGTAQPMARVVRSTTMRPGEQIHKEAPKLAKLAQKVYDDWNQDADGIDEELGAGGICQDIADEIAGHLNTKGIEASTVDNGGVGEQHVWVVAKTKDGVFNIDIPANIYETGGGYTWKKKQGILFNEDHVYIDRLSADPRDYAKYAGIEYD